MTEVDYIAQPASRTTLDAVEAILHTGHVTSIQVAAAYVTTRGLYDLIGRISTGMGDAWATVRKRWITSFDYCRTEPAALEALLAAPSSSVRVHDAHFCLSRGGAPRIPFHPKAFLFRGDHRDYALAGSGNLSRSGLSKGIEAGLVIGVDRGAAAEPKSLAAMQALRNWFSTTWNDAAPLDTALLAGYTELFESTENLRTPVPTEDDIASSDVGRRALSTKDLQKLRVCRNFWIDAGNITRNRGPNLPGNQLMMKRLSRVFFGFNPTSVTENTPIGTVQIQFNGGIAHDYSLTYSDNKMDKLVLPIPGSDGPPLYDNKYLLFRRTTPNLFTLTIGAQAEKTTWAKKSKTIGGAFKMGSGREWGVF